MVTVHYKCCSCTQTFPSSRGRSNHERKCNKINNATLIMRLQTAQRARQQMLAEMALHPPTNEAETLTLPDEEVHEHVNMDVDAPTSSRTSQPVCFFPLFCSCQQFTIKRIHRRTTISPQRDPVASGDPQNDSETNRHLLPHASLLQLRKEFLVLPHALYLYQFTPCQTSQSLKVPQHSRRRSTPLAFTGCMKVGDLRYTQELRQRLRRTIRPTLRRRMVKNDVPGGLSLVDP